jgi:hypothetical protein
MIGSAAPVCDIDLAVIADRDFMECLANLLPHSGHLQQDIC